MDIPELLRWRKKFVQSSTVSQMKVVASEFKERLNRPELHGHQIYELLRGTDFDTIIGLLEQF